MDTLNNQLNSQFNIEDIITDENVQHIPQANFETANGNLFSHLVDQQLGRLTAYIDLPEEWKDYEAQALEIAENARKKIVTAAKESPWAFAAGLIAITGILGVSYLALNRKATGALKKNVGANNDLNAQKRLNHHPSVHH